MEMAVKLKKLKRRVRQQKWNIEHLKRNSIPFQRSVNDEIKSNTGVGMNVNQRWTELKGVILSNAQKKIMYEKIE